MQLGMFRNPRLNKDAGPIRVHSGGQPIHDHIPNILADDLSILVMRGQGMPIGHEIKAVIVMLQPDPVFQNPVIMSQMQTPGRSHTRQHALPFDRTQTKASQ